jgi:glycosyltransferase involved in cell wall biosynthesis
VETAQVKAAWEALSPGHIHHIPAATPLGKIQKMDKTVARAHLSLPLDSKIFLCFGTHRMDKDYLTVIRAAKESKSRPYMLFVGPLISKNNPANILLELDYDYGALWDQYYPENKISELFDACDALILPYPDDYNKGSGVMLQACQHRLPIISTYGGYPAEFIRQHGIGFLYRDRDSKSLAAVYDHFTDMQSSEYRSLQDHLIRAQEVYSWQRLIKEYLRVFKFTDKELTEDV